MATSSQNILIIIAMIFFSTLCTSFLQVVGDDALVKQMCGATSSPYHCAACTTKSGHAMWTDIDVIEAVLLCGDGDVYKLLSDTQKIVGDGSTDVKVKDALNRCIPIFQSILDSGNMIRQEAAARQFHTASTSITGLIFMRFGTCSSYLSGITVPQPVNSGITNAVADYKIAMQLLDNDKSHKA